ncbi:hypothetical protein ACQ4PT_059431 [Festuca glaucescens]
MELEEGNHEAQQSGTSMLISGATRTGHVLSPSLINRSRAYLAAWSASDTQMVVSDDPMADWDNHITQSAQSTNVDSSELDSYLSKVPIRRTDHFDILSWWKTNSAEYPTLSRMAADILVAPASTVASESAFSTGKRVLSDFRSRMTPKTAEALVCLQDWIRATANTERSMASVHDIIMELEDEKC